MATITQRHSANGRRAAPPAEPVVVVGYDGSATGKAALAYAARRIGTRGRLVLVHAGEPAPEWFGAPSYHDIAEDYRARARSVLDGVDPEVTASVPCDTELVAGAPAKALLKVARECGAQEIVIGTRGTSLVRHGPGSVLHALLQEADRPVVVVPPGFDPYSDR